MVKQSSLKPKMSSPQDLIVMEIPVVIGLHLGVHALEGLHHLEGFLEELLAFYFRSSWARRVSCNPVPAVLVYLVLNNRGTSQFRLHKR